MVERLAIDWDTYSPHPKMRDAVSYLNQRSLDELLREVPAVEIHTGKRVLFDYRIYHQRDLSAVKKVYVLLSGFGVSAGSPDSGIKSLLTDLLLRETEPDTYAILVIGGLFSFPSTVRSRLLRWGSGALGVIADGVAELIQAKFTNCRTVTVSGYSLGGVLAPLVARTIDERRIAKVDQVCCGEPNYIATPSTSVDLLRRVAHSTSYRNDQITSTAIQPYIKVKQTPGTPLAMFTYRAKQYRPLLRRSLSMRFVVRDLALQAKSYPPKTKAIQVREALTYLTKRGIRVNLLHAEFSPLCHNDLFTQLADSLTTIKGHNLSVIFIHGAKADHGIEERGTLSAPFLVKPEMYWMAELPANPRS